jgi:imidazoleglycerol-phosphate dehydratase/histidinol-phosphatase
MKRKKVIIVSLDSVIHSTPPEDFTGYRFQQGVIVNLYKLNREAGFELVLWIMEEHWLKWLNGKKIAENRLSKIIDFLAGEAIEFRLVSKPTDTRLDTLDKLIRHLKQDKDNFDSIYLIGRQRKLKALADSSGLQFLQLTKRQAWRDMYYRLRFPVRNAEIRRHTGETAIRVKLVLDGTGDYHIQTGLGFFDHMLAQLARHSGCDLQVEVNGDLQVDEHHVIEDTALALGQAFRDALGDKKGIERYGFMLPMDDAQAQVSLDLSGRNWLVWQAEFKRERIGQMPTEMFYHFFKSLSDTAGCNLHIKAEGQNEHHKIEAIFKATARAIRMAVQRGRGDQEIPSTKGAL